MQKKSTVKMSDLLTMEDFEDMKQSDHNLSSFEKLLQVASVAAKKYDLANMNSENIEPNLDRNNVSCKRARTLVKEKKMKPMEFVIRRRHNEEQNLTSYALQEPSNSVKDPKLENFIQGGGGQNVKNSVINKSSRKADRPKRKLEDTTIISNEEWINAIEMKRKKKKKKKNSTNPPPPRLSEEFERKIMDEYGGTRIIRVIQKSLSATDVSKGHSRVSMPCSQVESFKFLDDDEMTVLRRARSITVPLIHRPRRNGVLLPLSETSLEFRQWDLHKDKKDFQQLNYQYLLRTNWNTVVLRDELERGDTIQIWAFRDVHNKLCMALVKL